MNQFLNSIYESNWKSGVLAGILLGLSFSPFNLALLMIPGFMLLFRISDRCNSARQVMYYTYLPFLIWNFITTYWLIMATVAGGVAAILANAVLMTIPMAVIFNLRKSGMHPIAVSLLVASAWVSYEFLHLRWDLSWPWLIIGNAFANFPSLVQYISITGVLGISFWVIFSANLLQNSHQTEKSGRDEHPHQNKNTDAFKDKVWLNPSTYRGINAYSLILVCTLPVMSVTYYLFSSPETSGEIEIVVAQPNYDSYLHNAGYDDTRVALEELIELTDSVRTQNTKAVFWPENAVMDAVFNEPYYYPSSRLLSISGEWGIPIITGVTWVKNYDTDHPRAYRVRRDGTKYNVFNAAAGFYPDGSVVFYEKAKLVPIVERFPFVDFLARFQNNWIDWGEISGYGRGNEIFNYQTGSALSPALVCYDSVFPDWARRFVLDGADYLTVITNDGWWGRTSGHIQHYDFARLRAIETRRTVVRSANNGISGMIYASGKVHSRTNYWEKTALNLVVPLHDKITIYTRFGDWIGLLSLIILIGFGVNRRFRITNSSESKQ